MTQTPGTLLNNRYRIESILGQGGMGAVYRALDEHLNVPVAVKENLFLSDDYARQFQREANILANLRNENLPGVRDYFLIKGQGQYLIMDYVAGEDLRQRIERLGILPEQEVALIGVALCDALSYLNTLNPPVIHRDIKPGNIKITPAGEIVLVDFGLAKFMLDDQATTTGARAMTPGFSPPEQYGTAHTDNRSDIYALGATLYAALTGKIPEDGLSRATNKAGLSPLKILRPKLSSRLANAIEKALSIEPGDRYQSAGDFRSELLEAVDLPQSTSSRVRIDPPLEEIFPSTTDQNQQKSGSSYPDVFAPDGKPGTEFRKPSRKIIQVVSGLFIITIILLLILFLPDTLRETQTTPTNAPNSAGEVLLTNTALPMDLTGSIVSEPNITSTPVLAPATQMSEAAVPTLEPTSIPATGGGSGQLAFVSKRTGIFQVWSMNIDGGAQLQLSNLEKGACQPDWSPDGKKLAVISPCESITSYNYSDSMIFILNSDGTNPTVLPVSVLGDFDPAWSPDGTRLAFSSLRSGVAHVYLYNFEDGSLLELSDTRYPDIQPVWNPNGTQLAIARSQNIYKIWLISDTGETQWQFSAPGEVLDFAPDWSPDGKWIVFTRSSINTLIPRIVRLALENRGLPVDEPLPPWNEGGELPAAKPDISPDGGWVLFESWPDGINHDIYLMDFEGRNRLRLTTDPALDSDPVWRP